MLKLGPCFFSSMAPTRGGLAGPNAVPSSPGGCKNNCRVSFHLQLFQERLPPLVCAGKKLGQGLQCCLLPTECTPKSEKCMCMPSAFVNVCVYVSLGIKLACFSSIFPAFFASSAHDCRDTECSKVGIVSAYQRSEQHEPTVPGNFTGLSYPVPNHLPWKDWHSLTSEP